VKYDEYFSACAWAMILQERWASAEARVVPYSETLDGIR
jgi:hypothetical protein